MFTGFTEKHSIFRRTVTIMVLAAFVLNFVLHDAVAAVDVINPPFELTEETPQTFAHLNIDTFTVPAHLGEIRYSYKGDSDKFIIHVQDAHCNPYAQHKVADIFGYLTNEYGLSVLNLEGGDGDYDLGTFTAISGEAIRREVADYFLEKGEINGAEYFAINNLDKVRLWGVENTDLYIANLDVFKDSLSFKEEVEAYIDNIATALGALKAKMYSPDLSKVDAVYTKYKAGEMEFQDYVDFLVEQAHKEKIDIDEYPNFSLLVKSMSKEKYIDFKKANCERADLMEELKKGLSKNEARELVIKTIDFKTKKISRKDFYNYLLEKGVVLGLDIRQFPQLTGYVEYVSIFESADRLKVMFEIDALEHRIEENLCSNEEQRKLVDLSRSLTLTRNIFNFTLTRNDYTYYLKNKKSFEVRGYIGFIEKESAKYKLDPSLNPKLDKLDNYIQKVERFFEYSFKRDDVFLENMIFEQKRDGVQSAVLMTGGFHTENLCSKFEQEGISYVSILPKFTSEKGYENPYFALLAGEATGVEQMLKPVLAMASTLQIASKLNTVLGDAVWGSLNVEAFDLAVEIRAAIVRVKEEAKSKGEPKRVVLMHNGDEIYAVGEGKTEAVELSDLIDSLGYDGAALGGTDSGISKGIITSDQRERRIKQFGRTWGEFIYDNFEGPVREEIFYAGVPVALGMAAVFVAAQYAAPLFAVTLGISRLIFIARHLPRSALEESDGDRVNAIGNIVSRLLIPSIISGLVFAMVPASLSGLGLAILLHISSNLILQPVLNWAFLSSDEPEGIAIAKGAIYNKDRKPKRLRSIAERRAPKAEDADKERKRRQKALEDFLAYVPAERTKLENIGRLNALRKDSFLRRFVPLRHKKILKADASLKADYLNGIDTIVGKSGRPDYKLGRVLGEGGFGKVFQATDQETGETVAVKFLKPAASNKDIQKIKFIQEYAKMKALKDMEVLPKGREIGSIIGSDRQEYYYMVMDYADGASLDEDMTVRADTNQWFTPYQVLQIVWQLVSFVDEFNKRGFVHGDLKPENIIVQYDHMGNPQVKIIDLGTSLYLPEGWRQMGYTEGTYHYMSKATHNGTYSLHTDLFAVGCILYELLNNGQLPYPYFDENSDFEEWIEFRRANLEQGVKSFRNMNEDMYAFADLMDILLDLDREEDGKVPEVDISKIYKKLVQMEEQVREDGLIAELLARKDVRMNRNILEHLMNDAYRDVSNKQGVAESLRERLCGIADASTEGVKTITRKRHGADYTYVVPEKIQDKYTGSNYQIESFLGAGGAAEVYKADMDGEKVALKVFSVGEKMTKAEYYDLLSFFKEYLILSGLGGEEVFVEAKGIGSYVGKDGRRYYYIALDLADSDLFSVIDQMDTAEGGLSRQEKIDIAGQLLYAGKVLQDNGLIWRDIKPENILIKTETYEGGQTRKRVMLSDPGIAIYSPNLDEWGRRSDGVGDTSRGELIGTPWYMPKSQFQGNYDSRTDMYALGLVLYELFYGQVEYIDHSRWPDQDGTNKWKGWLEYRDLQMENIASYDPEKDDAFKEFIVNMINDDGFKSFDEAYFSFAEISQEQRKEGARKIAQVAEGVREQRVDAEQDDDLIVFVDDEIGSQEAADDLELEVVPIIELEEDISLDKGIIKNPLRSYFIRLFELAGGRMDLVAGDDPKSGPARARLRTYGQSLYDNILGPVLEEGIFYLGLPILLMSIPALNIGLHPAIFISRAIFVIAHFLHKSKGNRLVIPALVSLAADIFAVPWGLTVVGLLVSSSIHIAANSLLVPLLNSLLARSGSKMRIEKGIFTNVEVFEEHFLEYNPLPEPGEDKVESNKEMANGRNWQQVFSRSQTGDLVRRLPRVNSEGEMTIDIAPEVIYTSPILGKRINVSSEVLGESNYGTVWKGKAVGGDLDGRDVAVKIIGPEASDSDGIRFKQQYLAMRRAERSGVPGVRRAYDAGYFVLGGERYYYIVEEYAPGTPMDRLADEYPEMITPEFVTDIADQILSTVKKIHESGIFYLDIKPENIVISPERDGKMKITIRDFGEAFFSNSGKVQLAPGTSVGDADYLLDRAIESGDYDQSADLYALGMTLYKLYNKAQNAFVASPAESAEPGWSSKKIIERAVAAYEDVQNYPVEDFIRRLLHEEFSSADEAIAHLETVRASLKLKESQGALQEETPFYVPVSLPGDDIQRNGPLGAIHNGGMSGENLQGITNDISLRSRNLNSKETVAILDALAGINERLRDLSPEEIDPDNGETIKGLLRNQLGRLLKGVSGRAEGAKIVTFSPEVGIADSENFVLAAVLDDGKVALVDGVFDDAILAKTAYLEEILFHEMLSMAYPEEGTDDHRARYADPSRGFISPVKGLTGIQRKMFPKAEGANILKHVLRNYVEHYLHVADAMSLRIAETMRDKEDEVILNRDQLELWRSILEGSAEWEGDMAYIPDIHGNVEGLKIMIDDLLSKGVRRFVFTGDYMDRDENSLKVMNILISLKNGTYLFEGEPIGQVKTTFLFGNHDQYFIEAMFGDYDSYDAWLYNWGTTVLMETDRYREDKEFAENVDLIHKAMLEEENSGGSRTDGYFRHIDVARDIRNTVRDIPELKETAIWMLTNLQLYHRSEIGGLSLHGGIPLDATGYVATEFRGQKGMASISAMQDSLSSLKGDLLTEAVYYSSEGDSEKLLRLDGVLDKAIGKGLDSLTEDQNVNGELLEAIYEGMSQMQLKARGWSVLDEFHYSKTSPVSVRKGWVDRLDKESVARQGFSDWVLGQMGVNMIVFGHTPLREGILNLDDKIFGIDTGLAKAMYAGGSSLVVSKDSLYVNSIDEDMVVSDIVVGRDSLIRDINRRLSLLNKVLGRIAQLKVLAASGENVSERVVDERLQETQIMRVSPEQGVTDWLESKRKNRGKLFWGGLVAPVVEEVLYGALPVLLGGVTSIMFTGGIGVSILLTASFAFELISGLIFISHHGARLTEGALKAPAIIAVARLALLPLLTVNPALYVSAAILVHSAVNLLFQAFNARREAMVAAIEGVSEEGGNFALMDMKAGRSLKDIAEEIANTSGRNILFSDGNLAIGKDGIDQKEAIASNILLSSDPNKAPEYKVRPYKLADAEDAPDLITFDHHFSDRIFADKTATVLLVDYIDEMRGRAPPEDVINSLNDRMYIATHKDSDSLLAYLVLNKYEELKKAGISLDFIRAFAYYTDHFRMPEGLPLEDETAIRVLSDLFYSAFFVNDRAFSEISESAVSIIKGVRGSVRDNGTLRNIMLKNSIPDDLRQDYYAYEREIEKDRLTLPIMESIFNGDSFDEFSEVVRRVKQTLGRVTYFRNDAIEDAGEYLEIGELPSTEEEYAVFVEEFSKEQGLSIERAYNLFGFVTLRSKRGINNKTFLDYINSRKDENADFRIARAAINIHEKGSSREVRLRSLGGFKLTESYKKLNAAESRKAYQRWKDSGSEGEFRKYEPWGGGPDRGAAAEIYGGVSYLTPEEITNAITGRSDTARLAGITVAPAKGKKEDESSYKFIGKEEAENPVALQMQELRSFLDQDATIPDFDLDNEQLDENSALSEKWRRALAPRVEISDRMETANLIRGRVDIPKVIKSSGSENITYEYKGVIKAGGEGVVVRARALSGDKDQGEVAIKIGGPMETISKKTRFLQEIGVLKWADNENISNIMHLTDSGSFVAPGSSPDAQGEEYLFQVLEYYPGGTLNRDISSERELSDNEIKNVLRVFGVMARLHEKGVIHADLKPDNIFVRRNPSGEIQDVVLGDFGIHVHSSSHVPEEGATLEIDKKRGLYTEAYRWPGEEGKYTEKTDLYAMGCVLTELVRGKSVWREIRDRKLAAPEAYDDYNVSLQEQIDFINDHEDFARDPILRLASILIAGENDLVHRRRGIMSSMELTDYLVRSGLISARELFGPLSIEDYEMFESQPGRIEDRTYYVQSSDSGIELFSGGEYYTAEGSIGRGIDVETAKDWNASITAENANVSRDNMQLIEEMQKRADGILNYREVIRNVLSEKGLSVSETEEVISSLSDVRSSFNWFNAKVEGYEKYLLGAENALAVNVVKRLKAVERDNPKIRFLVEEYLLHEALERTSLDHYEIIGITSTFFRRPPADSPGDTLLGQALRKFINEKARDSYAIKVSSRDKDAIDEEKKLVASAAEGNAWAIVNIDEPGTPPVTGGSAYDEHEELLASSVDLLTVTTDKQYLLEILRNLTGESLLEWSDLSPNIKISYHGEGFHKYVLRVEVSKVDGRELSILLAAKKEKEEGDIGGRETRDLVKLDGDGVPKYGGTITGDDGKLWLIEEFIEGDTVSSRAKRGRLSDSMRNNILETLFSIVKSLNGEAPRDIHAENFIVRKNSDKVVMVDLGDRRLDISGEDKASARNRMLFLAIVTAVYGSRNNVEDNYLIFDTMAESGIFTFDEALDAVASASEFIDDLGADEVGAMFYDSGRTLFPDFGADKDNVQPLVEFADFFNDSMNAWLAKSGRRRGSPEDNGAPGAAVEQVGEAKQAIEDIFAERGKAALNDLRKNQVDIIVMPGSEVYVAQQQAIEKKTARKLHKDYGQETLPFSYKYTDNWQESLLALMDERILDALKENEDKGSRALIYLPIPAEAVEGLFAPGGLLDADKYRVFQDRITIIPEEDIPADGTIDTVMHIVLAKALLNYKRFDAKEFGSRAKLSPESIDKIIKLLNAMIEPGTIDFTQYKGKERDLINSILAGDIAIKIKKIDFQDIIDWKEAQDEVLRSL